MLVGDQGKDPGNLIFVDLQAVQLPRCTMLRTDLFDVLGVRPSPTAFGLCDLPYFETVNAREQSVSGVGFVRLLWKKLDPQTANRFRISVRSKHHFTIES